MNTSVEILTRAAWSFLVFWAFLASTVTRWHGHDPYKVMTMTQTRFGITCVLLHLTPLECWCDGLKATHCYIMIDDGAMTTVNEQPIAQI